MISGETLSPPRQESGFAHASEAEFARILDFYLPDIDLFVEMTTLQQRLVRKKNRKVRRLRELYPAIRIKLFYARDFRALMLKYGRSALVAELSGTVGQVGPHHDAVPVPEGSADATIDALPGSEPDASSIDSQTTGERRSRAARRRAGRRAAARAAGLPAT